METYNDARIGLTVIFPFRNKRFPSEFLGLLNWLKSVFQDRIERREQVLHLRRTIERAKDEIYDASDLDFTNSPIGRMVPRDEVRKARLQWLHQQVMQILLGRASRLNFDETQEIKQAFNMLELHPNWIPNDSGYDGIFNQLESAEWLGLTPRH